MMQTRIGDQAAGAPHLVRELPEALIRRAIEASLPGQLLGIQTPTFSKGGGIIGFAKLRHVLKFLRKRNL